MTPFAIMLADALLATLLAGLVYAIGKWVRHPPLIHALWLLVLAKLVTPPMLFWPVPRSLLRWVSTAQSGPPSASEAELHRRPADSVLSVSVTPQHTDTAHSAGNRAEAAEASSSHQAAPAGLGWAALGAIWLGGCLAYIEVTRRRHRRLQRLLRHARPAAETLQQEAQALAGRLGLRRSVSVWQVPGCVPPMALFRREGLRIMLPTELLERLQGKGRAAVLLHELAHVRRRDHWVRRLELVVRAVYWWYPPVGWIGRQLRAAEEECCDLLAVEALRDGRHQYAQMLLDTVDFLARSPRWIVRHGLAMSAFSTLKRRLAMVMQDSLCVRLSGRSRLLVVGLGLLFLPMGLRWADAEPATEPHRLDAAAPATPTDVGPLPPETRVHKVTSRRDQLQMLPGTSYILATDRKIPQVQVNNAEVLDVTPISPTQVQVTAKMPGVTSLFLRDENEELHTVDVTVSDDGEYILQPSVIRVHPSGERTVLAAPKFRVREGRVVRLGHVGAEIIGAGADAAELTRLSLTFRGKVYREKDETYLDVTVSIERALPEGGVIRFVTQQLRAIQPIVLGKKVSLDLPRGDFDDERVLLEMVVDKFSRPSASAGADPAWERLGVRLRPVAPQRLRKMDSRYRGGMEVVEVRPDSAAAQSGVRRGDVLVGLHAWETISPEQVDHVLNRPDFQEMSPIKFYLIRGKETLYGYLPVQGQRTY